MNTEVNTDKWVEIQARRLASRESPVFDDLLQAGRMSVEHAKTMFDPARNVTFLSFATKNIRTAMVRELRVAINHGMNNRGGEGRRGKNENETGRPTMDSFDEPILLDSNRETTLHHIVPAKGVAVDTVLDIQKMLANLPDRDREILLAYAEGDTYRAIGERVGISHARAEQVVKKYLPILRKRMSS